MTETTSRDALREYVDKKRGNSIQRRLAELRLEYSDIGTIRNTALAALQGVERLSPTILPTQASGRWSYLNPNMSGLPKKCINPECPSYHHEKTKQCWSVRDCIRPDKGWFWVEHDLDAVEHRIYALILKWKQRLEQLRNGEDIHTPVACTLFDLPLCNNVKNPHTSQEDELWRKEVQWQGKDDPRRTLGKNFTYGGQYFYVKLVPQGTKTRAPYRISRGLYYNPSYVFTIPNIQTYKVKNDQGELVTPDFLNLAIRFVEEPENNEIQKRKAAIMEQCRKDKFSRTLYGGKRHAWFNNTETAKELFNHIIQGTVASYINESAILLQKRFPDSYLIHNQHDSLKWAFQYTGKDHELEEKEVLQECKNICQRVINYAEDSIPITATFYIKRREE